MPWRPMNAARLKPWRTSGSLRIRTGMPLHPKPVLIGHLQNHRRQGRAVGPRPGWKLIHGRIPEGNGWCRPIGKRA